MPIQNAFFYQVWPTLPGGKTMDLQYGNVRRNMAEIWKMVTRSIQDIQGVDPLSDARALAGFEFGEQGFENHYRIFYDAVNSAFKIQVNTNTEASPTWVDHFSVRQSDGQITVGALVASSLSLPGGAPGFYELRRVKEVGSGASQNFSFAPQIHFNTDSGFYLTDAGSGYPEVNYHTDNYKSLTFANQTGSTWTIAHNLNKRPVLAQAYDSAHRQIIPDKVSLIDVNTAVFYFYVSTNGSAVIGR